MKELSESKGFSGLLRIVQYRASVCCRYDAGKRNHSGKKYRSDQSGRRSISGMAGISHILITAALILLFAALKKNIKEG